MDVKVDVSNVILGSHESTNNAGIWLREHLDIPSYQPILNEFEEHFDCRVISESRTDPWAEPEKIVFATPADALAFMLKWS